MTRALLIAAAVAMASCTNLPEDDPSRVVRMRVLAIKAEPAEPRPGDSVTLSALIADPLDADSTRVHSWSLCLPLLAGAPEELADPAACVEPVNQLVLGSGETLAYTVPAEILDGLTPEEAMAGLDLPILLTVHGRAGRRDDALKRVRVSESTGPNGNPVLGAVEIDGTPPGSSSLTWGSRHEVGADWMDPDPNEPGTLEILVSAGTVPENEVASGGEAGWELRGGTPPATATVWIVGRDLRGGIDWTSATVPIVE